jgi:galactoside O-acetyltransferase
MSSSFLSLKELQDIGLKSYGKNVSISRHAVFYSPENIEIGNHVRIDDFCLLSGFIRVGSFVHISAYTCLYGQFGIDLHDYSGLSPRVTVLSGSDEFSGEFAVGAMVPDKIRKVQGSKVIIGKYVQIGAGSIIFPGCNLTEGCSVGAMSLVKSDIPSWKIAAGIPARIIKNRKNELVNKIKSIS